MSFVRKHSWKLIPLLFLLLVTKDIYLWDGIDAVLQFVILVSVWALFLAVVWILDEPLWRLMWVIWLRSRQRKHI
jgi:hypothetical protein